MLVLQRHANATAYAEIVLGPIPASAVGASIRVIVLDADHGRSRVGIEADRAIPVYRAELEGTHRSLPSGEGGR